MEAIFKLSVFMNMIDNISAPAGNAGKSLDKMTSQLNGLDEEFKKISKSGAAMTVLGTEMTKSALAPVGATFKTKKALSELASLGVEDLEMLESAATHFSDTWAGVTKVDFISASYDIKKNITSLTDEGVARYTEMAAITAKATKANLDEMTDFFAMGYGLYKDYYDDLSDMQFGEMFSAGISKSLQLFGMDSAKVKESLDSLGSTATSANVPLEEQLAILGMLKSVMPAGAAGDKYKEFIRTASSGGKELGLSFNYANGELMSMPEILATLKGKFGDTLDAAEKVKLAEVFGSDSALLIEHLYNNTDKLEQNILDLFDSMGQGIGVATEMANAINLTEGEKFDVLKQKIGNTVETIGNGMLPTINNWLNKGTELLESFSSWVVKNQDLVSTIFILIAIIGVAITAVGVFNMIFGFVGSTIVGSIKFVSSFVGVVKGIPSAFDTMRIHGMYAADSIRGGFNTIRTAGSKVITGIGSVSRSIGSMAKTAVINGAMALKNMALGLIGMAKQAIITAATAMPGMIASVWAFTTALLANPITWVVIGIIALIASIILLWQNWDTVVAWLKGAWQSAVQGVINGFTWIKEKIASVPDGVLALIAVFAPFIGIPLLIIKHWDTIKDFFGNLFSGIKDGFNGFIDNWIPNMFDSGKKLIGTFVEGIKSMIGMPAEIVSAGLTGIRNLLPFSDAKEGPLSKLTLSGSKVFTTIGEGMEKTVDVPQSITNESFSNVRSAFQLGNLGEAFNPIDTTQTISNEWLTNIQPIFDLNNLEELESPSTTEYKETKTVEKSVSAEISNTKETVTHKESGSRINISNITLHFDIRELEDLRFIKRLIEEAKNMCNQDNDDPESEPEYAF